MFVSMLRGRNAGAAGAVSSRAGPGAGAAARPAGGRRGAMAKVLATLRQHWKKSTFGACLLGWGGHWLYRRHW